MTDIRARKLMAKDWEMYFRKAAVRVEELDVAKGNRARAIRIGNFLSPNVGREVPIEAKGRTGRAVLRLEEGRSKQKLYFFEVTWDDAVPAPASMEGSTTSTTKSKISSGAVKARPATALAARTAAKLSGAKAANEETADKKPAPSAKKAETEKAKKTGNTEAW
jgi:hypothetical protein